MRVSDHIPDITWYKWLLLCPENGSGIPSEIFMGKYNTRKATPTYIVVKPAVLIICYFTLNVGILMTVTAVLTDSL